MWPAYPAIVGTWERPRKVDVDGLQGGGSPSGPHSIRAMVRGEVRRVGVQRELREDDLWRADREAMVRTQLSSRGIRDERVLEAMRTVPRHLFVSVELQELAYQDRTLPIGEGQTISQPYIVALMSEAAGVRPGDRVLEVGTGCGYQTAVLAALGAEVYTIEIVPALAARARQTLASMSFQVETRTGDAYQGWPEAAPFDAIVVTAAPAEIPPPLLNQLDAGGGRMVIPVGGEEVQELLVVRRRGAGFQEMRIAAVRFVPMTGEAERD
jgi:protein-L-isoaspartate(D-aspartate) O-methyltransferase